MKNVKLILMAVVAMLFLGMGSVNAQEKSTVIITADSYGGKCRIEIIKPNYEVEKKELGKDDNIFAHTKKEVDYWLNQNYKLVEVTANSVATVGEKFLFILIKEE